ncbi:MAG: glycosyltransferase family 2 protein [Promethearchaeota archaeon]
MQRNQDNPQVSIVIPTYNHAHFLKNCLQSVISQTFMNWEAIVINNFSEDNTIEIVKSFDDPRIHLVNFRNSGIIAASRNEGIRLAQGEYIAFLDSDDWWYPDKLELAIKYLANADIVFHDLAIHTQKGKKIFKRMRARHLKKPVFVDLMTSKTVLFNSSVVVKKNIINRVGNLSEDQSLAGVEDSDLWLRISRITEEFYYISKTLGAYWSGDGQFTEISERQIERVSALYSKHMPFLSDADKMQAEMLINYTFGRIKQQLGCRDEAVGLLKKSLHSRNLEIKLKSIYCMIKNHVSSWR